MEEIYQKGEGYVLSGRYEVCLFVIALECVIFDSGIIERGTFTL